MSEMPQDIPYLKILNTELITQVVTPTTDGLWATYEVVNIGTAPTTREDLIFAAAIFSNTQVHSSEHYFDDPVLAPNGGSHKGTLHFPAHHGIGINGDWELVFAIPAKGIGQGFTDEARLPFKVDMGESGEVHH